MNNPLADNAARIFSSNPNNNVIVKAPAGSGKTHLLAWRFVKLLATTTKPESILAVTFGRKAAQEIKNKIINWLLLAKEQINNPEACQTNQDFPAEVFDLLKHDQQQNWNLLENVNLLQIKTIDALCSQISNLDILNNSSHYDYVANADPIYNLAIKKMLQTADSRQANPRLKQAVSAGLYYFHGNVIKLTSHLEGMLLKRDSWHNLVANLQPDNIDSVDDNMQQAIIAYQANGLQAYSGLLIDYIENILNCFANLPNILALISEYFAGNSAELTATQTNNATFFVKWKDATKLPAKNDIDAWKAFPVLLLTASATIRKMADKSIGLPSKTDEYGKRAEYQKAKTDLKNIFASLQERDDNELFIACLQQLHTLPQSISLENSKNLLLFVELLYYSVQYLEKVFTQHNKTDYTAIAQKSLKALENNDIAYSINNKYKHLLIDEFQDTSNTQLQLFYKLTENWQEGENSIFLVGDPMQSIYAFREAKVAIFQNIWLHGWHTLPLQSQNLIVNFRATKPLVSWVNQRMSHLFGTKESAVSILFDEINYTKAESNNNNIATNPNTTPAQILTSPDMASCVLHTIAKIKNINPDATIAILATKKKYIHHLLPYLEKHQHSFVASGASKIWHTELLQDLLLLLKWLYFPFDISLQYALLRTQWFAVNIDELEQLRKQEWQLGKPLDIENTNLMQLSHKINLANSIWQEFANKERKDSWLKLVADLLNILPSCTMQHSNSNSILTAFYECLELATNDLGIDWKFLENSLQEISMDVSYFATTNTKNPIELMSIHKSKGLEFDYVIVPFVEKANTSSNRDMPILCHMDFVVDNKNMLLADIKPIGVSKKDAVSLYKTISFTQRIKQKFESKRLFYVVATRAKQEVYFIASVDEKNDNQVKVGKGSILEMLQAGSPEQITEHEIKAIKNSTNNMIPLKPHWQFAASPNMLLASKNILQDYSEANAKSTNSDLFAINRIQKQQIGTLLHQLIHYWLTDILIINPDNIDKLTNELTKTKQNECAFVTPDILHQNIELLLTNLTQHKTAIWLKTMPNIKSEQEIYYAKKLLVPDLFFIDNGILWIIDFKTSTPNEGELKEDFITQQTKLYKSQLTRYAKALLASDMANIADATTVKLGIYFVLLPDFISWDWETDIN